MDQKQNGNIKRIVNKLHESKIMNMIEEMTPKPLTVNGLLSEFKKKEESSLQTRERSRMTPMQHKTTSSSWNKNFLSPVKPTSGNLT